MTRRPDGPSSTSFGARALAVASLAVGAFGCSRTPPEPTPAATVQAEPAPRTTTASSRAGQAAAPRCIAELPASPPKIPPPAGPAECPPDPEPETTLPLAEVTFPDAPGAPRVEVELAKTPHDVERGLMYRRAMADDRGMLFRLDGRREHTFWMHNTCISLDMMFVDDDGVIVGIVEGAAPLTETTRSVGCPSVFVLEVNGGWARKRGVVPGQKITIPFAAR
ncbi:MAG: DUF192 domain-containing protein [Labilithrix sp.]|nr:DUF192 domain-containing protein [Labilithrix sp.]